MTDRPELAFLRPDAITALGADEREADTQESDFFCALRGEKYFVSGTLTLPVTDGSACVVHAWAALDEDNFYRVLAFWEDEGREDRPSFNAVLANDVPGVPNTIGLPLTLTITGPHQRPALHVAADGHPLHAEQQTGITAQRADAYTALIDGVRCVDAATLAPPDE